jgi:hypothetical protein
MKYLIVPNPNRFVSPLLLGEESIHKNFTASPKISSYWDWFIKSPLGWDGHGTRGVTGSPGRQSLIG